MHNIYRFRTLTFAFGQPLYWLSLLLIPFMLQLSDYMFETAWSRFLPDSRDKLIEVLRYEDNELAIRNATG